MASASNACLLLLVSVLGAQASTSPPQNNRAFYGVRSEKECAGNYVAPPSGGDGSCLLPGWWQCADSDPKTCYAGGLVRTRDVSLCCFEVPAPLSLHKVPSVEETRHGRSGTRRRREDRQVNERHGDDKRHASNAQEMRAENTVQRTSSAFSPLGHTSMATVALVALLIAAIASFFITVHRSPPRTPADLL